MIVKNIFGLLCILIAVQYTTGAGIGRQFSPISAGFLPVSILPGAQPTICKTYEYFTNGSNPCASTNPTEADTTCDLACQCVHGAFSGKCTSFPTGFYPKPDPSGEPKMCDCNYKDVNPIALPAGTCDGPISTAIREQTCSSSEVITGSNKCALHCYCRHAKVYGGACSEVNGFCKCKDSW